MAAACRGSAVSAGSEQLPAPNRRPLASQPACGSLDVIKPNPLRLQPPLHLLHMGPHPNFQVQDP